MFFTVSYTSKTRELNMNFSYRIWLTAQLALAAIVTPLAADNNNNNNNGYYCTEESFCDEECGEFCIGAELLFLRLSHIYNIYSELPPPTINNIFFSHNFEPGLRITSSWTQKNHERKILFDYTCFSFNQENISPPSIASLLIPTPKEKINSKFSFNLQQIDLLYEAFSIKNCFCGKLALSGGFRWLKKKNSLEQFSPPNLQGSFHSDSNTVGISLRIETNTPLFCNWHVITRCGISILSGKTNFSVNSGVNSVQSQQSTVKQNAAGSIEGSLRLARDFQYWCRKGSIYLGFEGNRYTSDYPLPNISATDMNLIGFNAGLGFCF
jgi:hypothetical protein